MPTPAQLFANKQNAKKSTGPRSAEGKARASRNSLKHGLCAEATVLPHEDPEEYEHLREIIHRDFAARSEFECLHLDLLARAYWRLIRSSRVECGMFEKRLIALADHEHAEHEEMDFDQGISVCYIHFAKEFDLHRRYETAIERSYYKALDTISHLRGTVTDLRGRRATSESASRPLAVAAGSASESPLQAASAPEENIPARTSATKPGPAPASPTESESSPAATTPESIPQLAHPISKTPVGFVSHESHICPDHQAGVTPETDLEPPHGGRRIA